MPHTPSSPSSHSAARRDHKRWEQMPKHEQLALAETHNHTCLEQEAAVNSCKQLRLGVAAARPEKEAEHR